MTQEPNNILLYLKAHQHQVGAVLLSLEEAEECYLGPRAHCQGRHHALFTSILQHSCTIRLSPVKQSVPDSHCYTHTAVAEWLVDTGQPLGNQSHSIGVCQAVTKRTTWIGNWCWYECFGCCRCFPETLRTSTAQEKHCSISINLNSMPIWVSWALWVLFQDPKDNYSTRKALTYRHQFEQHAAIGNNTAKLSYFVDQRSTKINDCMNLAPHEHCTAEGSRAQRLPLLAVRMCPDLTPLCDGLLGAPLRYSHNGTLTLLCLGQLPTLISWHLWSSKSMSVNNSFTFI